MPASSPEAKVPGRRPIADCDDPVFPTLYFKGDSHGAAATVRGKVSVLSDGAVRWQFVREVVIDRDYQCFEGEADDVYRSRPMTEGCSGGERCC